MACSGQREHDESADHRLLVVNLTVVSAAKECGQYQRAQHEGAGDESDADRPGHTTDMPYSAPDQKFYVGRTSTGDILRITRQASPLEVSVTLDEMSWAPAAGEVSSSGPDAKTIPARANTTRRLNNQVEPFWRQTQP